MSLGPNGNPVMNLLAILSRKKKHIDEIVAVFRSRKDDVYKRILA